MGFLEQIQWILLQNIVNFIVYFKRSPWITSANQPDEVKTYPGKDYLFASRIFRPAGLKGKLPLVVRIHGGGFMMNNPASEDEQCRLLADKVKCIVVSIDYRKAPRNRFPGAYEDVVALTQAIIEDKTLAVDAKKVVLSGSSSGGNLALGAAQDPRLRGKLLGVMGISPIVDMVEPLQEKIKTRPDPSVPDFLIDSYDRLVGFYLDGQTRLSDVRLSPGRFSSRQDLPQHVYLISIEHDVLWKETKDMAERLAQGKPKHGTETDWEAGNVKWWLVKGQKHAFETWPEKDKSLEPARLVAVEVLRQNMISWLRSVFQIA